MKIFNVNQTVAHMIFNDIYSISKEILLKIIKYGIYIYYIMFNVNLIYDI